MAHDDVGTYVRDHTHEVTGEHGTVLMAAPGLWIALADENSQPDLAVMDMQAHMLAENVSSGALILSQRLAARTFGPVPAQWLAAGIGMHRSTEPDLRLGAQAFLYEYLQMLDLMEASLTDLDRIAQQS